jgi:hypothetical protein
MELLEGCAPEARLQRRASARPKREGAWQTKRSAFLLGALRRSGLLREGTATATFGCDACRQKQLCAGGRGASVSGFVSLKLVATRSNWNIQIKFPGHFSDYF